MFMLCYSFLMYILLISLLINMLVNYIFYFSMLLCYFFSHDILVHEITITYSYMYFYLTNKN